MLAATPIGNAEDASAHLRRLLAEADVVAAEDTRRLRALAARLGVDDRRSRASATTSTTRSSASAELLEVVAGGGTVVVVTDAGMPAVSDPGFRVVARRRRRRACRSRRRPVRAPC